MPDSIRTSAAGVCSASAESLASQSAISASRSGGQPQGLSRRGTSAAAMPERSPCRTPGATSSSAVEPPSMKASPPKIRLAGFAAWWKASVSSAAPAFARTISRETGMYLVLPEVVPDDSAK